MFASRCLVTNIIWLTLHSWILNCWTAFWILLRLNFLNWVWRESYVTTDFQSASLSWNKAPIWDLRPDLYYCQTVAGLLIWSALSAERTGLSFRIAAGPRQRNHSRVRVPWDLPPYFSVSFSSPPATRRAFWLRWKCSIPWIHDWTLFYNFGRTE
jgi:hypothetical protein